MKYFIIVGHKYKTEPSFYDWDKEKRYPTYEEDGDKKEFPVQQFENLRAAEVWLLKNAPEYYFGSNIIEVYKDGSTKPNGDFSLIAVPSYYECVYNTTDRALIINTILSEKTTE